MNQPKNIQIDYELFKAMMTYIDRHPDLDDPDYRFIVRGIQDKLRTITNRTFYTLYKTSKDEDTRAFARKIYLDRMGIPESFRWGNDQDVNISRQTANYML